MLAYKNVLFSIEERETKEKKNNSHTNKSYFYDGLLAMQFMNSRQNLIIDTYLYRDAQKRNKTRDL